MVLHSGRGIPAPKPAWLIAKVSALLSFVSINLGFEGIDPR